MIDERSLLFLSACKQHALGNFRNTSRIQIMFFCKAEMCIQQGLFNIAVQMAAIGKAFLNGRQQVLQMLQCRAVRQYMFDQLTI